MLMGRKNCEGFLKLPRQSAMKSLMYSVWMSSVTEVAVVAPEIAIGD
jgi:hypothetical protein